MLTFRVVFEYFDGVRVLAQRTTENSVTHIARAIAQVRPSLLSFNLALDACAKGAQGDLAMDLMSQATLRPPMPVLPTRTKMAIAPASPSDFRPRPLAPLRPHGPAVKAPLDQ